MTTWQLIGAPDDADAFVETFKTKAEAVERGADLLQWQGWPDRVVAVNALSDGADCCYGDAGSLRIVRAP